MERIDAVEPAGTQNVHLNWSQDISFYFCKGMCLHAQSYPRFIRRVCSSRPGGTVSRDRKVQWTSLAW